MEKGGSVRLDEDDNEGGAETAAATTLLIESTTTATNREGKGVRAYGGTRWNQMEPDVKEEEKCYWLVLKEATLTYNQRWKLEMWLFETQKNAIKMVKHA